MEESTLSNPVAFFESCFNSDGMRALEKSFYAPYIYDEDFKKMFDTVNVDKENQKVILYLSDIDANGKSFPIEEVKYFSTHLEQYLDKEIRKTKKLINKYISDSKQKGDHIRTFLDWILKKTTFLRQNNFHFFQEHPLCLSSLEDISSYIQSQISTDKINIESSSLQDNPIYAIFSFLKGYNKDGQKIMSDTEYERLISAIEEMIKTESKPSIDPIQRINIPNDLLRYCFYILHKQLYGIKPQKRFIIEFIKENLQQFHNTEFSTLISDFSKKPHSTTDNYIPDVIKSTFKVNKS